MPPTSAVDVAERALPAASTLPSIVSSNRSRYSCHACRNRKAKCDRTLPRCTSCVQRNLECVFVLPPVKLRKALDQQGSVTPPGAEVGLPHAGATNFLTTVDGTSTNEKCDGPKQTFTNKSPGFSTFSGLGMANLTPSVRILPRPTTNGQRSQLRDESSGTSSCSPTMSTPPTMAALQHSSKPNPRSLASIGFSNPSLGLEASLANLTTEPVRIATGQMAPCSASTPRSAVSVTNIPISDILPSHDFFLDLPSNPTMLPDDVVQFLDSLGPAELDMFASLDSPGTHIATSNNDSEEVLSNPTGETGSPSTLPGASLDVLQKPSTTANIPQPCGLAVFSHSATSPSHPTEGMSTEVASNANSIYPSLFTPADLLFHSEVFKTAMYSFCRRTYKFYAKPLYRRLIYRLEHGLISEELQLCIASNTYSMVGSAAFQSIPPFMIKAVYNERLRAMVPSILERNSIDSITVMNLLATAFMGAGYYSTSFSIQAAVARKLLMWRVHLIDQHPPPPPLSDVHPSHANDPVIDATQMTNELLIDHLRMLWWMTVIYDMCISLMFGLQPSFDLDSCAVDWPSNPTELRDSLTSALDEVGSAFYTDGTFPTLVLSSSIKFPRGKARIPVTAISHDIVVIRHYRATDPVRWLDEWRRLNNELARWRSEVTISLVSTTCESDSEQTHSKRRNPHRSPQSKLAHAMKKFHTHKLTLYLLLLIYHNHLDGPLGVQIQSGPPVSDLHGDPDEGRDDNDYGINAQTDQDDIEVPEVDGIPRQVAQAVMTECHTRSWTAVQELHDIMDSFKDLTRFPHYHLLLGSLYSSAVICTQIIHGRGLLTADVYRASLILQRCKERLVELAPHYIGNLKILQAISALEARPQRYYSLTLNHLL